MRFLKWAWDNVREVYFFIKPIRFVFIPLILLLWALLASDQGQDSVRFLVETDPRCPHYGRIAVFLAMVCLTALQAWYWSRQLLRVDSVSGTSADHPDAEKYMPRTLGASTFLIAIGALARAGFLGYSGRIDHTMRVILVTCAILVALLVLFLVFTVQRRKRIGPSPHVATHTGFPKLTIRMLHLTALLALAFVIWTALSPLTAGRVFQSPSLLMLSAALWAGLGSWLAYWFDSNKVPLVATFLIAAIVFSFFNDNHAVRTLDGAIGPRKSVDATYDEWLKKLDAKYPGENHPVFVVATEGGGIRAAYWTAAVLTAIQDQAPQFSDHLFAISSVSGGSLGSTVFTALVADSDRKSVIGDCDSDGGVNSYRLAAQQMLSYDFLAPTLGSLLHADLVQRFLPIGFIPDRAKALETGWEAGWSSHIRDAQAADNFFASGFAKMYADRQNVLLPSLFLNGTSVEVGNRLIASNCDLSDNSIPNSVDLFNQLGRDMRLSTAANNSARFTYVAPAGSVHDAAGKLLQHVVDGGYFENSGAQTAMNVITHLQTKHPNPIYLILIKFQEIPTQPVPPTRFMNEVLSPLRALGNTRSARGDLAFDEATLLPNVTKFEFLLTQEQKGIALPLGWLLAQRTRNAIDIQIGPAVPPEVPQGIRLYVQKNVDNLLTIAQLVHAAPQLGLDAVQKAANQSEAEAKK
jgi:hypothetical protein